LVQIMLHAKRTSILKWVAEWPQGNPQAGGFARLDPTQQPAPCNDLGRLISKAVKAGVAPCKAGCFDGFADQNQN
jgi:hypothetical protein